MYFIECTESSRIDAVKEAASSRVVSKRQWHRGVLLIYYQIILFSIEKVKHWSQKQEEKKPNAARVIPESVAIQSFFEMWESWVLTIEQWFIGTHRICRYSYSSAQPRWNEYSWHDIAWMLAFIFRDSVPTIASSATNANSNPKWKCLPYAIKAISPKQQVQRLLRE